MRKESNNNFVAEQPKRHWAVFEETGRVLPLPDPHKLGVGRADFPKEYGPWFAQAMPTAWEPATRFVSTGELLAARRGEGMSAAPGAGGGGEGIGYKLGCGGNADEAFSRDTGKYVKTAGGGSSPGPVHRGKVTPPPPAQVRQEAGKTANPAGGYDPQGNPVYTYMQCSGKLYDPEGGHTATGSSGKDVGILKGRNNPAMQPVPYVGPIPVGLWRIGAWRPDKTYMGPHVRELLPDPATTTVVASMGRDPKTFYMHGGGINASQGCILMPPNVRLALPEGAWIRVLPCEAA